MTKVRVRVRVRICTRPGVCIITDFFIHTSGLVCNISHFFNLSGYGIFLKPGNIFVACFCTFFKFFNVTPFVRCPN